jgi:CrcB protein
MLRTAFLIAVGGGIGSVFRYLTAIAVQKYYASVFPLATFITNVLGCLLIGIIVGILEKNALSDSNLKWLLVTGFCGGYTTFSAFGYENISLLESNNPAMALLYIGASIFMGLAAVWLGLFLVR